MLHHSCREVILFMQLLVAVQWAMIGGCFRVPNLHCYKLEMAEVKKLSFLNRNKRGHPPTQALQMPIAVSSTDNDIYPHSHTLFILIPRVQKSSDWSTRPAPLSFLKCQRTKQLCISAGLANLVLLFRVYWLESPIHAPKNSFRFVASLKLPSRMLLIV